MDSSPWSNTCVLPLYLLLLHLVYLSIKCRHQLTALPFRISKTPGLVYAALALITSLQTSPQLIQGSYHVTVATLTYISSQLGHDTVQSPFSATVTCRLLFWHFVWISVSFFDDEQPCIYTTLWAFLLQILLLKCLSVCLHKFPRSFTPGELAVSTQIAFTVLWNSCCFSTLLPKIWSFFASNDITDAQTSKGDADIKAVSVVIAGGIVVRVMGQCLTSLTTMTSGHFYVYNIGLTLLQYVILWIELAHEPVTWMMSFIVNDHIKVELVLYWLLCCLLSLAVIYRQNVTNRKASTIERKLFHGLVLAVYVPGLMLAPDLLYIASWLALTVFVVVESVRVCGVDPVSDQLNTLLSIFLDDKDCGRLALTPVYLLVGVSYPLWAHCFIYPPPNIVTYGEMSAYSGLLSVGVGDTAASVCGSLMGRTHWTASSPKTVEGTVASVLSQLVFVWLLSLAGPVALTPFVVLGVVATSLLETFTSHIDNLLLPVFMYTLFTTCSRLFENLPFLLIV